MNSKQRFLSSLYVRSLALMFVISALFMTGSSAVANPKYASIVMDADTGLILYQRYADKKLHPASLTKVMTLLLAFEAIETGKLSLNERIPISRNAANEVPSKLGLRAGSSIRVKDAIYALVTKSANDVATAMAEKIGGTEDNFTRMMNRKARAIGMNRTVFRNATGLHSRRQVSTARDIAKMARYVIAEYPEYYRYFSKRSFTYAGKTYRNHNRLLGKYDGMDGMKTGYVNASGFNLVASAVRNNRRIIGVVFGGRTGNSRNAHMATILNRGFAKLNEIRVASAKAPLPPKKPGVLIALANIQKNKKLLSASITKKDWPQEWSIINPALENGMFGELIGQGDYDPSGSKRIETGLIAIAAHKGEDITRALASQKRPKPKELKLAIADKEWAVQVGAFKSRSRTNSVLENTLSDLPDQYTNAQPAIAPVKTANGYIYRARLTGLSETQALAACQHYLKDCITIAPH